MRRKIQSRVRNPLNKNRRRKGGEAMEQISFHDLPGAAQRRLVHGTLSGVKRFFSDPAQWEAYAAWHVKRYGRPPERGFGCPESKV